MLLCSLVVGLAVGAAGRPGEIRADNQPAQLDIRAAGDSSVRVTLKPVSFEPDFPFTPALAERKYPAPVISLRHVDRAVKARVGGVNVEVLPRPLTVAVTGADGTPVQA